MIIQSILARIGIVLVLVALAFVGGWLRGHNRGWDSATAHYTKVVNAALAANAHDAAAIAQLQAANDQCAQDAAAQAVQVAQAQSQMAEQAKTSAAQLSAAQKRLQEVEHANQDNRVWASGRVPDGIAAGLRQ